MMPTVGLLEQPVHGMHIRSSKLATLTFVPDESVFNVPHTPRETLNESILNHDFNIYTRHTVSLEDKSKDTQSLVLFPIIRTEYH